MRIAFYSRVFPPQTGGMERFALDLCTWLSKQGHQVTVVGPPDAEGSFDHSLGFPVVRNPTPWQVLTAFRSADVVHVNGHSLRGEVVTALAGQRPVITHHGYQAVCPSGLAWSPRGACRADSTHPGPCPACHEQSAAKRLATHLHRAGAHVASINVCISHHQQRKIGVPRSRVIWDPVGSHAFAAHAPGPGDGSLVGFAGRLVQEKGLDCLLHALTRLPGVRLDVVGDGPMRAEWTQLTQELGLNTRVRFLGMQPFSGVAELYGRAGVVCVPSAWDEPFGYAAAEAMAMGRPVVALPRGALVELLQDGRGFLATEPTVAALADALKEALDDEHARTTAGAAARTFALHHLAMDVTGAQYEDSYRAAWRGLVRRTMR